MQQNGPYRILISGGGTGGHVYPAIAIANALMERDGQTEILFVGARGRMEMQKVPEAGFEIIGLWISGLQRKLTPANLLFPFKVISSLFRSSSILRKFKPDAVVGVGGYASGPILYSATRRKIPALIQEQNSYAGLTNKILSKKVQRICVAYEGMDKYFDREKIVITGNPVRTDIMEIRDKRSEGYRLFGLSPERRTVLVLGGSLGARTINEAVLRHVDKINASGSQWLWQCGSYYFKEIGARLSLVSAEHIRLKEFIKQMDLAYAVADVVISRAGALSISELCLVRKPVIFIPSPNVAEDHQTKNAMALVDKHAAILVKDSDAREEMVPTALGLLRDEARKGELSTNIGKLGRPDAAKDIVDELFKMIS